MAKREFKKLTKEEKKQIFDFLLEDDGFWEVLQHFNYKQNQEYCLFGMSPRTLDESLICAVRCGLHYIDTL